MSDKLNLDDFELKELNEENFKDSVIERKNVVTEFTIDLIENHQTDLQKLKKELSAQVSLCRATIDNIERNHPHVAEMSDEEKHSVWMAFENQNIVNEAEPKLVQVDEQLAKYAELIDGMYQKFGFVPSEQAITIDPDVLKE